MRRRLVSSRARKAVGEWLSRFSSAELLSGKIFRGMDELESLGDEVQPAVAEALEANDGTARIAAAWCLFCFATQVPTAITEPGLIERAEETLAAGLECEGVQERTLALGFMSIGFVPHKAIGTLAKMLSDPDESIRVGAAAALAGCTPGDDADVEFGVRDVTKILMQGLQCDNELIVGVAASALVRSGLNKSLALQGLVRAYRAGPPVAKYSILSAMNQFGAVAEIADAVAETIKDEALSPVLRRLAAKQLGRITKGTDKGVRELHDALGSAELDVVFGAVEGLIERGGPLKQACRKLASLLTAEADETRRAACVGLRVMNGAAIGALPNLIERLPDEPNIDVIMELTYAIAAIGEAAIPALIDLIERGDARRIRGATAALGLIGKVAAEKIAERLVATKNTQLRMIYLLILREMGNDAEPAVPALIAILDDTDDEELADIATLAIFLCPQAGASAAPALVRALVNRSAEVSQAAERTLKMIGQPAVPALEEASQSADGNARQRIAEVLLYFHPGEEKRSSRLERLGRDDLVRLFALVGAFLEQNKKAGWREISAAIRDQIDFSRPDGRRVGSSPNSIANAVKELSELLKVGPLTDNAGNRKGGLTIKGCKLLKEARQHLRLKYGNKEGFP